MADRKLHSEHAHNTGPRAYTNERYRAVPPEQHASYSALIDQILAAADLNTISAKAIRKQLQEKVDYDIAPQKVRRRCADVRYHAVHIRY